MGTIERRLRERKNRIEEIIASAKHIFRLKGFASTSMHDIATNSELSRRTLYLYFKSKDELAVAVAATGLEKLAADVDSVEREGGDAFTRLNFILGLYLELYHKDPSAFLMILGFNESVREIGIKHELTKRCYQAIGRICDAVAKLLTEGSADGSVRKFPAPNLTATTLITLIHGMLHTAVTNGDIIQGATAIESSALLDEAFELVTHYIEPN